MKMLKAGGIILGLFLGAVGSANASTVDYAYSFSGSGFSGSGQIIVNSANNSVQGLSGTINGSSMQLIAANSSNLYTQPGTGLQWSYDDLYFKSGTPFDNAGLLFNFGKNGVGNIYSIGSQLYLSVSNPVSDFNPGVKISAAISQTPLPPGLPLFLSALAGLWFFFGRKSKIADDSAAFR
jgi:hypothetical protein